MSTKRIAALALTCALGAAACGADDPGSSERPITIAEANLVAEALFQNFAFGGADFRLAAQLPGGTSYVIEGSIDWLDHTGRARVTVTNGADAPIVEVVWTEIGVAERIPALTELAATLGQNVVWVERPADPEGRELDSLLAVITAMATDQRENPTLLRQAGVSFLRTDNIADSDVDVYQYSEQTRLWLDDDGLLLRFESNNSTDSRPVIIDLEAHRTVEIELPPVEALTPITAVTELYDATLSS